MLSQRRLVAQNLSPRAANTTFYRSVPYIRSYATKKQPIDKVPHEWRKRIVETLPRKKLFLEGKIVHGRSRDFSWRNPYLKHKLEKAFAPDHSEKSAIFEAQSSQDIRSAVKMCYENEIPIVMRGEGSGHTAGAFNFGSGLVVDIARMNRVVDLDASKGTITVEPGISIEDVRNAALSVGWDMRQYPTTVATHPATIAGFLQTTQYGIGSARYGTTMDFGNIVDMKVIPVTQEASEVALDGVAHGREILGVTRSLGTSAIVSEVTLALAPAIYWVDVGICFPRAHEALHFAMHMHKRATIEIRQLSVFPSSVLTASLNAGERKNHIHFFRNKIPAHGHPRGVHIDLADAGIQPDMDRQVFEMPAHIDETEALVILSVNEASLPFLNQVARGRGGHTVYIEHSRGGYGFIETSTWQHAATRLSKYYSGVQYSHYELDLGEVNREMLTETERKMEHVKTIVNRSIVTRKEYLRAMDERLVSLARKTEAQDVETVIPDFVDESFLENNDIRHRPAYFYEFYRRDDGSTGIVAQVNFRTQTQNAGQLEMRIRNLRAGLLRVLDGRVCESFVDPHQYNPDKIFMEPNTNQAQLRRAAKKLFDPKALLNPRELQV